MSVVHPRNYKTYCVTVSQCVEEKMLQMEDLQQFPI